MFLRAFSYAPPEFARLGISGITYLGIDFLNKRHGICGWLAYTSSAVVVSMRTWLPSVVTYFAAKHGISIARGKTLVLIGICCYEYDLLFLSKQICHRCAIPLSLLLTSTMVKSDSIRAQCNDDHHRHGHDKTFDKCPDSDLEATFE